MTWNVFPIAHSLGNFGAEWDALNHRYYGGHPYMDSRFIEALLNHFATGAEHLCVHQSGDSVDAMIILTRIRPGIWRQFSPSQRQVSPTLLRRPELLDTLYGQLPGIALIIELMNEDPDFSPAEFFENRPCWRSAISAETISVALTSEFDAYWNGRSRKLVQNLRRYQRRVEQEFGSGALRVLTHQDDMADAVGRFGQLESNGWKGKQGSAVHADNIQGSFYTQVMRNLSRTGQAEVLEYWLGDQLAASRLVIRNASMSVMLKTAYNESMSSFAPGRLLLKELLNREFGKDSQRTVEFYTNATEDQKAWATDHRTIYHITFFRFAWLAKLYDLVRSGNAGFSRGMRQLQTLRCRDQYVTD